MTQCSRVLTDLIAAGPRGICGNHWLDVHIPRYPARIWELKRRYAILSEPCHEHDHASSVARYRLVRSDPSSGQGLKPMNLGGLDFVERGPTMHPLDGGSVRASDTPRSEVSAVSRSRIVPRIEWHAQSQYERKGDTVTALVGPPERSSLILPREEVVGGPERTHESATGQPDGSAPSVSALARTTAMENGSVPSHGERIAGEQIRSTPPIDGTEARSAAGSASTDAGRAAQLVLGVA